MYRPQESRRRSPRPYRGPPGTQRQRDRSPSQESSLREPEYSRPNDLNQRRRTPERVVIAVCGMTGSGKSSFIQMISGKQMKIGHGLKSCTTEVQEVSCRVGQHEITLVDTPGFGDDTRDDVDILEEIVRWMTASFHEGMLLSGLIYLHDINKKRMGGGTKNLRLFRKLCGDGNLGNVALVTSMWDIVDPRNGQKKEDELKAEGTFWSPIIAAGASTYRYDNSKASADRIVLSMVNNAPFMLRIQEEVIMDHKKLIETAAGLSINEELARLLEQQRQELAAIVEEIEVANKESNRKLLHSMEAERRDMKRQLEQTLEDQHRLSRDLEAQNEHLVAQNRSLERQMEEMSLQEARYEEVYSLAQRGIDIAKQEQREVEIERRRRLEAEERLVFADRVAYDSEFFFGLPCRNPRCRASLAGPRFHCWEGLECWRCGGISKFRV